MNLCSIRIFASHIYQLFFNYKKVIKAPSYYYEQELKSHRQIFFDHLRSLFQKGQYEWYYFLYGFDRKSMTKDKMKEYISPYGKFADIRDKLNYNPPFKTPYNYIALLNDKFVFERYMYSLGIASPKNKYIIENGVVTHLDSNGDISFDKFISTDMDVFCKPFAGMLGQDIFSLKIKNSKIYINDNTSTIEVVKENLKKGKFLIQERIEQHPLMSKVHPKSVNTLRIQSVIGANGDIIPFCVKARFGANDSIIDNWATGGVLIGVDIETGTLHEYGFLKPGFGTRTTKHPNTGVTFKDFTIPYFKEAIDLVTLAHKYLYGIHSIGWDVAITPNGPTIIEANHRWEISSTQGTHGGLMSFIEENFKLHK